MGAEKYCSLFGGFDDVKKESFEVQRYFKEKMVYGATDGFKIYSISCSIEGVGDI